MNKMASVNDVMDFLDRIPKFQTSGSAAIHPGLEKITRFCLELGNPHLEYPVIHVAGTNGKGTTSYMLEQVYHHAGYKTGLFTSPHLLRYNERVRINQQEISDEELTVFFSEYAGLMREYGLSYFEMATAFGFYTFARHKVDIAVVEVGLGGRLDSTNIVQSSLSIITSIGLDHRDILGDTETEIAAEKAGIIKPGVPVILGNISSESRAVIEAAAGEKEAPVLRAAEHHPELENHIYKAVNPSITFKTRLIESVNKWNIAAVLMAVQSLNSSFPVSEKTTVEALEAFEGAPGRFEKLLHNRDWYFCGAHNPQALASVVESVIGLGGKSPVLIFSMMKDKVSMDSMKLLFTFDERYFFQQSGERAATFESIRSMMEVKPITEENYHTILKALETELVIIAGSFYFYPVIKGWLDKIIK